jgi:bacteriocin-like protein
MARYQQNMQSPIELTEEQLDQVSGGSAIVLNGTNQSCNSLQALCNSSGHATLNIVVPGEGVVCQI